MSREDRSHLHALEQRLSSERVRLADARTPDERALRTVWVAGIAKEIAQEREFLGLPPEDPPADLTDDELLAALLTGGV